MDNAILKGKLTLFLLKAYVCFIVCISLFNISAALFKNHVWSFNTSLKLKNSDCLFC